MNNRWSRFSTLIVFVTITIIGFMFWVGGLLFVWIVLKFFGVTTDPWSMISALSTAIAAAAVFSAGFIAYRELNEVASSRHIEVADHLFEELNSSENIAARRWVYTNLPGDPEEGMKVLTPEGRAAMKQVLNSLDHVAFMTQAGWIPEDIIMPWMHPMIVKSWEKIGPYVIYEQQRRNEPYYYQKVCELAKRCNVWRQKNMGKMKVNWIKNAL